MADIVVNGRLNDYLKPIYSYVGKPPVSIKIIETEDYCYVGKTAVGLSNLTDQPIWQILRIEFIGNETNVTRADGNDLFDNIWDNVEALVYA